MSHSLYIERALFIVGDPGDGKSTQLRSIFVDRRLGTQGKIPVEKKPVRTHWLSIDRRLYLRLTSPHENGESPKDFFTDIRSHTKKGRWVFACPLQPDARNNMPGLVDSISQFVDEFSPERVRVCFISPNRAGTSNPARILPLVKQLWKVDSGLECIVVDATTKNRNGSLYADFLDFS
jgi:hypothetical protein